MELIDVCDKERSQCPETRVLKPEQGCFQTEQVLRGFVYSGDQSPWATARLLRAAVLHATGAGNAIQLPERSVDAHIGLIHAVVGLATFPQVKSRYPQHGR